jgi:hypothetical protein
MAPVLTLAVIWMITGCEEIMDVDFSGDATRNLVVEGLITTDTMPHQVTLSYTGDYFKITDKDMAIGAEVSITDGENLFALAEVSPGIYQTDSTVYGIAGNTYTLHIRLPDGRAYEASDYLRHCGALDSIRQSPNYNTYITGYGYDVLLYAQEPQPGGDHYLYLLYLQHELYSDTITEVSFANDEFVNGNYVSDFAVYRIAEADIDTVPTTVTLEMHSVSKEYYAFLSALMVETVWRGSPWDGPPADLPGNVSNGATGFFRASDVKRKSRDFLPLPRVN